MSDADRFEAFVRSYQDMVYALAVRLLGRPAEAEDAAQTVFLKAFERFDAIGDSPSAGGWLKTVTRNVCLNHLTRYRKRWRLFSELAAPDGTASPVETALVTDDSPGLDLEEAEQREQLERALQALPDHQRVPVVLHHFDGMSYAEIAEALGVSLSKVKTDIHRGREALKQHVTRAHASR
jgi:RNA polymerase sigma-70 factor (ECF subfamily)